MKKLNILILGIGGNVSQGIMTALKLSKIPCRIVGACISPESLGLYFCDTSYISPYADEPMFIPWVVDVCKKEDIDIIFSGVEEIIQSLESNRKFLNSVKSIFISSSLEYLLIGNDKEKTCEWLKSKGLNYPLFASSNNKKAISEMIEKTGFPVLAKPKKGKGSAGIMLINNMQELALVPKENYVIQEYLGDSNSEYTIGCYINKGGLLEDLIICKRFLKYGTTFKAEIVHDDSIERECRKICNSFKAIGPLNIQLRMHKGKPVCFELNVRFSGTTPLRARWGYNDVAGMINEYILYRPVGLHPFDKGLAYRYFNEAYIDINMQEQMIENGYVQDCYEYNNIKEIN